MNTEQLQSLKDLIVAGHPITGAFNVDDELAKDELNALNIAAPGGISEMLEYVITHKNRSNVGSDTTGTLILGRLQHVADAAVGVDVFGSGTITTLIGKHAAMAFLTMLKSTHLTSIDFVNSEIDIAYTALEAMWVWKTADSDALKAFSQNKQSIASFNGFPKIKTGWVQAARAL